MLLLIRGKFKCILAAAAFTLTWLGFVYPVANAFVLLLAGFPLALMLFAQLKRFVINRLS